MLKDYLEVGGGGFIYHSLNLPGLWLYDLRTEIEGLL